MCQSGYEPDKIEVSDAMVAASLAVLRQSGLLEYPGLIDESLVKDVLRAGLAARKISISVDR